MTITLYGLSTCDQCKRALEAAGRPARFRDVRAEPLGEDEVAEIVRAFGDRVINRQSTTWRGFSEFLRLSEPEVQIAAQPAVMKRPVIRDGETWFLGWDEDVQAALLQ